MPVERLSNGLLKIRSRHRLLRQTFQQNLPLVQKAGGAISTLKREMLDESFLQKRKLAVLRMAFDRADGLAVEVRRGTTQVGMVWLVPSGLSTMTAQLRHCAAPQPNLVPVIPRYSRRKSFIVSSSRTSLGPYARPLMVTVSIVT